MENNEFYFNKHGICTNPNRTDRSLFGCYLVVKTAQRGGLWGYGLEAWNGSNGGVSFGVSDKMLVYPSENDAFAAAMHDAFLRGYSQNQPQLKLF